ncbi:MAG: tryptophan--tRNA ligase [Alphaproteobacteria bacterium]|nr:tryptophan--tRNA ligase [Alphaproteobacteria bacterium]
MSKPRVLSGVQPTGNLHLGNYLGAIRNWVGLQDSHACLFMLADLHAITVPQNPADLRRNTRETAAAYIACGIDPKKSAIFPQSAVTMHSELAWILNCHTPLGWLNRMTQFKEKSGKNKENAPLGLYAYPVLMAADILGYHATHVPVGEDQKQHLELARDIAGAFNRAYGEEFFPLPEPLILPTAARIMSLRDGSKKMSKSDPSDYSRITLTDDADAIAKKIRKATSDSTPGVTYEPATRPEIANLLTIYAALTDRTPQAVAEEFKSEQTSNFKSKLAEIAVEKLSPITANMRELMNDYSMLDALLKEGAERARAIATPIFTQARQRVGFLQV